MMGKCRVCHDYVPDRAASCVTRRYPDVCFSCEPGVIADDLAELCRAQTEALTECRKERDNLRSACGQALSICDDCQGKHNHNNSLFNVLGAAISMELESELLALCKTRGVLLEKCQQERGEAQDELAGEQAAVEELNKVIRKCYLFFEAFPPSEGDDVTNRTQNAADELYRTCRCAVGVD